MARHFIDLRIHNGNLEVIATPEGIEHIKEYLADETTQRSYNDMWWELLESYSVNGSYHLVDPVDIGALTDAPIIADIPAIEGEDGEVKAYAPETKFWWHSNYATVNELQLLSEGRTFVIPAADTEAEGVNQPKQ